MDWERPSRDNWYQMATTTAVQRVLSRNPGRIKIGDNRLAFADAKPLTPHQQKTRTAQAKARWVSGMGTGIRSVSISREEMERINALPPEEAVRARMALASGPPSGA